jgi:hypothetical protein
MNIPNGIAGVVDTGGKFTDVGSLQIGSANFFYIYGPSASVAICGFAICRPNIFMQLADLQFADSNFIADLLFCKSANSLFFSLENTCLKCSKLNSYKIKNSATNTCG